MRKLSEEQKQAANARRRERYNRDPEYAEKRRAENRRWSQSSPCAKQRSRERARDRYARSPELIWESAIGRKHGLKAGDYDAMLAAQGGGCAICGTKEPSSTASRFCVDHCHETGVVRGLLCRKCNLALGYFQDDTGRMEVAIGYLQRPRVSN